MIKYDLVIIGGGPSGMMAAIAARENGIKDILIIDREIELGGMLINCIHSGFTSKYIEGDLTAPEYIQSLVDKLIEYEIEYKTSTDVISVHTNKTIVAVNEEGILEISSRAIILSMGCRERPLGYKNILSHRCSGIITSLSTLKLVNRAGIMPGKEVLVLGSGDPALFATRSLVLEGAKIKGIIETTEGLSAINEEVKNFIKDFNIPIMLKSRVTNVFGKERVEGVNIGLLDENNKVVPNSKSYISCDTLVLSIYLHPENTLALKAGIYIDSESSKMILKDNMETSIEGIFACGTVVEGYEQINKIEMESELVGKYVAEYLNN